MGLSLPQLQAPLDTLAEWLRRRPAKPMGSPRVGSNPTGVALGVDSDELGLEASGARVRAHCWKALLSGRCELARLGLCLGVASPRGHGKPVSSHLTANGLERPGQAIDVKLVASANGAWVHAGRMVQQRSQSRRANALMPDGHTTPNAEPLAAKFFPSVPQSLLKHVSFAMKGLARI